MKHIEFRLGVALVVSLLMTFHGMTVAQPTVLRGVASGGTLRWYRVHEPAGADPAAALPVVLAFHGGGGNALQFLNSTGLIATADLEGFLLVAPEGTPLPGLPSFTLQTWNAGGCCGSAAAQGVDDVAFVDALLADLAGEWNIDPARVYATGLSNGGMMAYRLASELGERIAAVAPVAAALGTGLAPPDRPVALMAFHGLLDTRVPFGGGVGTGISGFDFPSQEETLQWFEGINQASVSPYPARVEGHAELYVGDATTTGADLYYWLLRDHGHAWPGVPSSVNPNEPINTDLDANALIWDFFATHPRSTVIRPLPQPCGPLPRLSASEPVLGQTLALALVGAPAFAPGLLLASAPASAPVMLPDGCLVHLDLATADPVVAFTSGPFGGATFFFPIPSDPLLDAAALTLQVATFGPVGTLALTNGLALTFGS